MTLDISKNQWRSTGGIPFWLVWAEIELTVHVALPQKPIKCLNRFSNADKRHLELTVQIYILSPKDFQERILKNSATQHPLQALGSGFQPNIMRNHVSQFTVGDFSK